MRLCRPLQREAFSQKDSLLAGSTPKENGEALRHGWRELPAGQQALVAYTRIIQPRMAWFNGMSLSSASY
jgi:hypothetical protein